MPIFNPPAVLSGNAAGNILMDGFNIFMHEDDGSGGGDIYMELGTIHFDPAGAHINSDGSGNLTLTPGGGGSVTVGQALMTGQLNLNGETLFFSDSTYCADDGFGLFNFAAGLFNLASPLAVGGTLHLTNNPLNFDISAIAQSDGSGNLTLGCTTFILNGNTELNGITGMTGNVSVSSGTLSMNGGEVYFDGLGAAIQGDGSGNLGIFGATVNVFRGLNVSNDISIASGAISTQSGQFNAIGGIPMDNSHSIGAVGVVGAARLTNQTATGTVLQVIGSNFYTGGPGFIVSASLVCNVSVISGSIKFQLSYYDQFTNTAQIIDLVPTGASTPNISATGLYYFNDVSVLHKGGNNITIQSTLVSGGSHTFSCAASLKTVG